MLIDQLLDVVLFDVGGTLVAEAPPATPTGALVPTLLPNVARDLATLSGMVRLGAATNTAVMTEAEVRSLLAKVGINQYFEVVVTSHDVGAAKPDPAVLLVASNLLGDIDPSRTLYVGDRPTDREAACAAGSHFAFVGDDGVLAAVQRWAKRAGSRGCEVVGSEP